MKKYTWAENIDDELWQNDMFNTIDECIEDAKKNYLMKSGRKIAVGTFQPYVINIDAMPILETLETNAYEEYGEVAGDWINYEEKQVNELSEHLSECVKKWLAENNSIPKFGEIINVKEVIIK